MKKTIKLLAVVMVIAMLAITLVSCAKTLKGDYSSTSEFFGVKTTVTYSFDGKNVTITTVTGAGTLSNTTTQKGTYEIKEDPENADAEIIVFTFTSEDGSSTTTKTCTFSDGKEGDVKFIKIDGEQYNLNK